VVAADQRHAVRVAHLEAEEEEEGFERVEAAVDKVAWGLSVVLAPAWWAMEWMGEDDDGECTYP
jgi:hypothetical protein